MNRKVKAIHTCLLIYGGTGKGRGKEMLAQPKAGLHWQGCRQGETQNGKYNSETVCYIQQFHLCGFVSSFNAKKVVTLSWKFKLSCTLGYLSIWRTFWFSITELFCYKKEQVGCFRNLNVSVWRCQWLPVHSFLPTSRMFPILGRFPDKAAVTDPASWFPTASQNCWSSEKCSQTSLLLGSAINSWRWAHTAQAASFVSGGNPVQFSSRDSWTPTFTRTNLLDRTNLPHLSSLHAPGGKNYTSSWLQLDRYRRYFLLILWSHLHSFSLSEKAEVALQKQICRRAPWHRRHRKNLKNSCKVIKECGFIGAPGQKDVELSRDPNFLKHWGCSECCFECSPWINKTRVFWKRTEATELYFVK